MYADSLIYYPIIYYSKLENLKHTSYIHAFDNSSLLAKSGIEPVEEVIFQVAGVVVDKHLPPFYTVDEPVLSSLYTGFILTAT